MSYAYPAILRAAAEVAPDQSFLRSGSRTLTFAEVDRDSVAVAADLIGRGVRPGDPVAIDRTDRLGWLIAFFGIVRIGLVVAQTSTTIITATDIAGPPAVDTEPWEQAVHSQTPATRFDRVRTHGELLDTARMGPGADGRIAHRATVALLTLSEFGLPS